MRTLLVFLPTSFSLSRIFTFEKWKILFLTPSSNRYLEYVSVQGGKKEGFEAGLGVVAVEDFKKTLAQTLTHMIHPDTSLNNLDSLTFFFIYRIYRSQF